MQDRPEMDTSLSRRRVPLSPYRERATAERRRYPQAHSVRATAVQRHLERTGRGHRANNAVTDVRRGGSGAARRPEAALTSLLQRQHQKQTQSILLRLGSVPARPRVLTRAAPYGAATPLSRSAE